MPRHKITNQAELRRSFWEAFPHFDEQARAAGIRSKRQNHHCATVRCAWVEYVDGMSKDGTISSSLADRTIL